MGEPLYRGGFGDVWKREYCGQEVVVKVLRTPYNKGSRDIVGVSHGLLSPSMRGLTKRDNLCRGFARRS